jgi:phospholipid/cholesterol/gamma-HCH transport system substrate-binding protein
MSLPAARQLATRWGSLSPRTRIGAFVVAIALVLGVTLVIVRPFEAGTIEVTARFAATPGLYEGNAVAVLGVPQGRITKIVAHDTYVAVTLEIPADLAIPAGARAVILSPNPVSDRTVELVPAYKFGPRMSDGATIPLDRTAAPLPVDTILSNLDELAHTLGPDGANKDGALSDVIGNAARLADGTGPDIRATLSAIAQTLPSLVGDPGRIRQLLASLDRLTTALATHDQTLDRVFDSVTTATTQLADERGTLAAAITTMSAALGQVSTFVTKNHGRLKGSLESLKTISSALVADQDALEKTFTTAPLGFQNFANIVDTDAPCIDRPGARCPALFARLVLPSGTAAITNAYCRDLISTVIPILASLPGVKQVNQALKSIRPATPADALCLAQHAVFDGHNEGSPGILPAPDLNLARYLP